MTAPPTGFQPLGLGGSECDGLVYVPSGYRAEEGAPLALMLHGAGGDARGGLSLFLSLADEAGLVLLAPELREERTWDVLTGGYGPDVEFIDQALEKMFDRLAVDAGRVVVVGFSDGASYALSLWSLPTGTCSRMRSLSRRGSWRPRPAGASRPTSSRTASRRRPPDREDEPPDRAATGARGLRGRV